MNETCVTGKHLYQVRVLWKKLKGPIPEGLLVCHKCDNGWCINFDHVFLGTHKDNTQDMLRKGRHWVPKGEDSPHSKLTNETIEFIKKNYKFRGKESNNGPALAKRFGVTEQQITRIARGYR